MYDHEDFGSIITRVVGWQHVAQQMPLPELSATVATWQDELAQTLDAFNDICANRRTVTGPPTCSNSPSGRSPAWPRPSRSSPSASTSASTRPRNRTDTAGPPESKSLPA